MVTPAEQFLHALFEGVDGAVELRPRPFLPHVRRFVPTRNGCLRRELEQYVSTCEEGKHEAFYGVALRKIGAPDGSLKNCTFLTCLFIDADFKNTSDDAVRQVIKRFPLPPSIQIMSGNGLHAYWLLKSAIDIQKDVEGTAHLLRRFSHWFREIADEDVSEPARVLRLPGTNNFKYDPPKLAVLELLEPNRRYEIEDIAEHLPTEKDVPRSSRFTVPDTIKEGQRHSMLFGLLRSQKARGISFEAALQTCLVENRVRCNPPLDEHKLRSHLERSWRQHDKIEILTQEGHSFPLTEAGDAEFFAAFAGDDVRFDHRRGRWLVFNDHYWAPQSGGEVYRIALEAIRTRQAAAQEISDSDARQRHMRWAVGGESRKRQSNMLALAQNYIPIADTGDDWDADPWLLCVRNGVVDLRTGTLRPGRPEDRITLCASVDFDPDATCPLWDRTLSSVFAGDPALVSYMDRYLGYSLTGDVREESLAFCWGNGGAGKGTVMNTFEWLLGDYADNLPFSALELHDHAGIPNDIAKLVGKRFVTSSETNDVSRFNEARVKALTGRDPITARFLHREWFTFQPVAKFWLAANDKPIVRDTSEGFWRRIHLIPFKQSFKDNPDRELKDKLRTEGKGILARAVRGCLAWQATRLQPPEAVTKATQEYRTESDPLERFIEACCVRDEKKSATMGHLFKRYRAWANSPNEKRLTNRQFSELVRERFGDRVQENKAIQRVEVKGIGLMDLDWDGGL